MDQRKRNPSRSPEGGPSRKHVKPVQWQKTTAAPRGNSESLRSSPSNTTPRHVNPGAASPQSRDKDSLNGEVPSGRSTPQVGSSTLATTNSIAGAVKDVEGVTNTNAILELLQSFSTQIVEQASLQVSKDQAESKVKRLQREYNANRENFKKYPAIAESKTGDKTAATEDHETKKQRLQKHQVSHRDLLGKFANLIGQIASAERTDTVSREEFHQLQESVSTLHKEVEAQQAVNNTLRDDNSTLREANTSLEDELSRIRTTADSARDEAKKQGERIDDAKNVVDSTRQRMESFMSEGLKAEIEKIAAEGPELVKTVGRHSETMTSLEAELANLKEKPQAIAVGPGTDIQPVLDRLSRIEAEFKTFESQQDEKDQLVDEEIQEKTRDLQQQIANMKVELTGFQQSLSAAHAAISSTAPAVEVQRVKDGLNAASNDLAKQSELISVLQECAGTWTALKVSLSDLKKKVQFLESQRNASQTPTPVSPAQPQFVPPTQPRAMSNGINANSPHINGVQAPQHSSPFGNGGVQAPPLPPFVTQEFDRLQKLIDQLGHVVNSLKQRQDNLTTDEVVRQMVDQMSRMYPEAKTFQDAIWRVNTVEREWKSQMKGIQVEVNRTRNTAESAYTKAEIAKTEVEKVETAAKASVRVAKNAVEDLANKIRTLEANAESASADMVGNASANVLSTLGSLRVRVDEAIELAKSAEKDAQINSERIAELQTGVADLSEVATLGKQEFQRVEERMGTLTIEVGQVRGQVTAFEKVRNLD